MKLLHFATNFSLILAVLKLIGLNLSWFVVFFPLMLYVSMMLALFFCAFFISRF